MDIFGFGSVAMIGIVIVLVVVIVAVAAIVQWLGDRDARDRP